MKVHRTQKFIQKNYKKLEKKSNLMKPFFLANNNVVKFLNNRVFY